MADPTGRTTPEPERTEPAADQTEHDATANREEVEHREEVDHDLAHDEFGGLNWGACFFGWLVAIALAVLLSSVVGAVAAAFGSSVDLALDERDAGTIGVAAAVLLTTVLVVGYYAGGYVAGRMSRFDGTRQGVGVWVIGLLVTIVAVAVGASFGAQYNILDRVDLPRIPVPDAQLNQGVVLTSVAVVLGTLLAAMLGGRVGHRYHDKVDRAAHLVVGPID